MQWILTNKKCLISIGISWLLLTQMLIADAADILSSKTGDYCVLPIGDIDRDGRTDHAVSKIADGFGVQAVTYILFGDQSLSADNFSVEYLTAHAGYIIRGVATAPFACVPGRGSSAWHESVASAPNQLSLVSKRSNTYTSSPIDKPIYYTAVDLTHIGYTANKMLNSINSWGEVVGGSPAFIYDGEIHYLGTLGGDISYAYGINSLGHVAGYSLTGEIDELGLIHRAFLFDGFSMLNLGLPSYSAAFDLNDADQIVGGSYFNLAEGQLYRGFIYQNGETTILGTLGGLESEASAINLSGQVVGSASGFFLGPGGTSYASTRAFLYEKGAMQDLGSLGFYCYEDYDDGGIACYEHSQATDINNRGQIVGFSTTSEFGVHAFLSENSVLKDLGTLVGGRQSWAFAINDSGQIVGSIDNGDGTYYGFLFDQNTMYDLNDLIIDLPINSSIWGAFDINNFGQILSKHGYLLNPIYEKFTSGEQFFFSDKLGQKLNFEYWFSSEDISPCHGLAQVEILFENVTDGGEHRWLPADESVPCGDFKNWRAASVSVPKALVGKSATVRIRVITFGTNQTFTVYMRHFSSNHTLTNGVPVTGLSGAQDSQRYFSLEVPAGATDLQVAIFGGTGDADLYVRFGALPTLDDYDCPSDYWWPDNNDETCDFPTLTAGTYYVMLHGYGAYSGVTLVASYTGACPELVLDNDTVTDTVTHESCRITAGDAFVVTATGDATFRAGERITLRPGFRVQARGRFRVQMDPNLRP